MLKANASEQNTLSESECCQITGPGRCFSWVVAQRRQEMQTKEPERAESRPRGHFWSLKGPQKSRKVHLDAAGAFRNLPLPAVGIQEIHLLAVGTSSGSRCYNETARSRCYWLFADSTTEVNLDRLVVVASRLWHTWMRFCPTTHGKKSTRTRRQKKAPPPLKKS